MTGARLVDECFMSQVHGYWIKVTKFCRCAVQSSDNLTLSDGLKATHAGYLSFGDDWWISQSSHQSDLGDLASEKRREVVNRQHRARWFVVAAGACC